MSELRGRHALPRSDGHDEVHDRLVRPPVLEEVCRSTMYTNARRSARAIRSTNFHCRAAHHADAIASVCHQRDTDAVVMVMKPRKQDEEDLPEVIAEAMKAADVVFTPIGQTPTGCRRRCCLRMSPW